MKKSRERRRRRARGPSPSPRASPAAGAAEPVGYCRPPLATRFKPGQSGNPSGRPTRMRMLARLLAQELNERVEAKENGRLRSVTKLEAAVKQLANRAASGDQRAILLVFSLLEADHDRPSPAPERLGDNEALVIAELIRRFGPGAAPGPSAQTPVAGGGGAAG